MDNQNPTDPNQGNMGGDQTPVADPGMGQTVPQAPAEPVMPEAPTEPAAPVMPASEPASEQPAMPADSGMGGEQGGEQNPTGGAPVV